MTCHKHLIASAAFMLLAGAASAAPEHFTVERDTGSTAYSGGYGFSDLSGRGTLNFSSRLISAVNLVSASVQPVPDAALQVSTSTTSTGKVRYLSIGVAAPLTALTLSADGAALSVLGAKTDGGLVLSTTKNGATHGSGSLSISDLRVDLVTKTVYADIVGANGVGTLNDRALWTYDSISGPTTFTPSLLDNTYSWTLSPPTITLSGLFLLNASDIDNIFAKALNLNNVGRAGLNAVNNRWPPNSAGFGSLTISAVPEPSTCVLMGVGMAALVLSGRRRATR